MKHGEILFTANMDVYSVCQQQRCQYTMLLWKSSWTWPKAETGGTFVRVTTSSGTKNQIIRKDWR